MKQLFLIFFLFLLLFSNSLKAQDTINLISGKQIITKSLHEEPNSSILKYDISFHEKVKQRSVDLLYVYSINYADKSQKIIYRQDSATGFQLSQKQMALYITGERDAIKNYKAPWITITGFAAGATATYFVQFWGLLTPVAYATAFGIITPRVHSSPALSSTVMSDFNYLEGYKYCATRKKVKNALFGTIAGVVASSLTLYTLYLINKVP
jgi:hypothetical protein